jgi:aminopeptidase N
MRIRASFPLRNVLIGAASTLVLAGVFSSAALAATAANAPGAAAKAPARLTLPDDVTPDHYDIAVVPDAKALSFKGSETIEVTAHTAVRSITLNAADIDFARVRLDEQAGKPQITLDPEQQTARFTFAAPLTPGRHRLQIDYTGKIYQQASGLFALDYDTAHGKARALFTQFENSDARRFAPSFDEPGKKATFTLSAVTPADQMAISNMPIAATEALPGGLKRVRFAETPKMSSYLLFFGLGDFERVSRKVDGVDVGVVVKRGDTAQAQFALDAASQILPYYNSYFGTKYPLPKMDLIGGPGSSQFFGAMENWGAIFYFERDLLIDPRIATEDDRQNVYIVVAHEMAHQWFGDLVTMNWWDDLWLNEGFASWMENKVTDHFHPEWKVWLQQMNSKQRAMQVDSKAGSHAVITPIYDVLQASSAFDDITYDKGASVIRMLEAYTGEDAWRAGIRNYVAHHAYANATTDDLWREIDAVSPLKVAGIAHDFTLQPGVPMVRVDESRCGGDRASGVFKLTPDQYFAFPAQATGHWRIPLKVEPPAQQAVVLDQARELKTADCAAVVNAGQTSYVRTLYEGATATKIADLYPRLSPVDQLGVLNDTYAEADAGYAPMADLMTLSTRLPNGADPVVWESLAGQFAAFDRLYDGLPGQARFRAYALSRLRPELERLSWDAKPTDPTNTAAERTAVLSVMGRMGDAMVVAEAHKRFEAMAHGEHQDPEVRRAVLSIVALNADAATWEEIHQLARKAPSALEKHEFYSLLGRARDPALAQRALELALSGETEPTTAPAIISAVSSAHPKLALDFAAAQWAKIDPLLDSSARVSYVTRLAQGASDVVVADDLDAFAQAHIEPGARGDVRKARAQIEYNAKVRAERLPEIDRWLDGRGG